MYISVYWEVLTKQCAFSQNGMTLQNNVYLLKTGSPNKQCAFSQNGMTLQNNVYFPITGSLNKTMYMFLL